MLFRSSIEFANFFDEGDGTDAARCPTGVMVVDTGDGPGARGHRVGEMKMAGRRGQSRDTYISRPRQEIETIENGYLRLDVLRLKVRQSVGGIRKVAECFVANFQCSTGGGGEVDEGVNCDRIGGRRDCSDCRNQRGLHEGFHCWFGLELREFLDGNPPG